MKADLFKSYRMQMLYYTLLSAGITAVLDILCVFVVSRIMYYIRRAASVSRELSDKMLESGGRNVRSLSGGSETMVGGMTPPDGDSVRITPDGIKLFGEQFHWVAVFLIAALSVIIFVLIFNLLTRRMTGYIREITASIQRIAQGDFDKEVPVRYDNEFTVMAQNLNVMALDLRLLKDKEKKAENTKNELITNVAHDLRTPLTSIIGYLDILNNNPQLSEENKKKYMDIAYRKSKRLEKLINDLFCFTKLSYGNMPLKTGLIDVVKLLEQQIDEFYPCFEDNNLVCDFKAYEPSIQVLGDGEMIARAFENLVSNAIKYGKSGKIIKVVVRKSGEHVKVTVINYGSVIPEEDLPHIFERFYRVEQSRQESTGGTGLGLSIAKSIIEKHDGHIRARSSMAGTAFEVYLPLASNPDIAE